MGDAGCFEIAEFLAGLGAVVDASSTRTARIVSHEQALLDAARRGDAAACARLFGDVGGLDINAEIAGETPLLLAVIVAVSRLWKSSCEREQIQTTPMPFSRRGRSIVLFSGAVVRSCSGCCLKSALIP